MNTLLQLVGVTTILAAYAGRNVLRRNVTSQLNMFGAAALATSAFVANQWGFVVLNTVWAMVALYGYVRQGA